MIRQRRIVHLRMTHRTQTGTALIQPAGLAGELDLDIHIPRAELSNPANQPAKLQLDRLT